MLSILHNRFFSMIVFDIIFKYNVQCLVPRIKVAGKCSCSKGLCIIDLE